jgi:hypothetical protein
MVKLVIALVKPEIAVVLFIVRLVSVGAVLDVIVKAAELLTDVMDVFPGPILREPLYAVTVDIAEFAPEIVVVP